MAVYSDIQGKRAGNFGQGSVGVTVQVPRAVVGAVPDPERVVEQDNPLPAALRFFVCDGEFVVVLDSLETVLHLVRRPIVVAANQADAAVKTRHPLCSLDGWQEE